MNSAVVLRATILSLKILLLPWAGLIYLSRFYSGVHYSVAFIAGIILGTFSLLFGPLEINAAELAV